MARVTITRLAIENLGPFRERQELDLSVAHNRPVILIKALNGSGKTTLLTALQIGLYGQKAVSSIRRAEYDQLVGALQRRDAIGSCIEIALTVDIGGVRKELVVKRSWQRRGATLVEAMVVLCDGSEDIDFTQGWDQFFGEILPAELSQLFLFDGEKIEALANPERLPGILRRATETFLGLGGIDAVTNDLRAVERRAITKAKDSSGEFAKVKDELVEWESQQVNLAHRVTVLLQEQSAARNAVDQTQRVLETFTQQARDAGLGAYERAAELRMRARSAKSAHAEARALMVEAISDPFAPLAWLRGSLWDRYLALWEADQAIQYGKTLREEFKKRDKRLVQRLAKDLPKKTVDAIREAMQEDMTKLQTETRKGAIFQAGDNPREALGRMIHAIGAMRVALDRATLARSHSERSEADIDQIPAQEQLAALLADLSEKSKAVSSAELTLQEISARLADAQSNLLHVEMRLNAARVRIATEFKERTLEAKSIEAAARAKGALAAFKERLLASKAQWLSDMITTEFRNLIRKRNLISRVIVDPNTYNVSIEDGKGNEIPMDRLSAGERQLLAIAVLTALIKERKGRFPVVVDTPLARLDRHHREALVKRFFTTVSHQVMILSTDEEVEGSVYQAVKPYTNREFVLEFDDDSGMTRVLLARPVLQVVAKA